MAFNYNSGTYNILFCINKETPHGVSFAFKLTSLEQCAGLLQQYPTRCTQNKM
jgi:hypothetical protein